MIVKKKTGKYVEAYQLGQHSEKEQELIKLNLIKPREDRTYEIFSQESVNGMGELAKKGDYFKIDNASFPYPNDKIFFEENHRKIEKNLYEQIPKELLAWCIGEGETEEIDFLTQKKGLVISESDEQNYFQAPLWGCTLSAAKDAIIIFYSIQRNERGEIIDIDYNFVARHEFKKTYEIVRS